MELVITLVIVAAAAAYIARSIYRSLQGKACGCCKDCGGKTKS